MKKTGYAPFITSYQKYYGILQERNVPSVIVLTQTGFCGQN
jgi:hypothetical protein